MSASRYLLGIDLGSSSVKASLTDSESGQVTESCFMPEDEMRIESPHPGWAEQDPETWWKYTVLAIKKLLTNRNAGSVEAIGISYQMHGLVLLDERGTPVRPSIIWCDSRAVESGQKLERELGTSFCLKKLLNTPGNFTAAKLAWVQANEPAHYARATVAMLPGDYLAWRLTGRQQTTRSGLSEGIMYDFTAEDISHEIMDRIGGHLTPEIVPSFGIHGHVTESASRETGLAAGTPLTYRAGDQPNNALSLKVARPGQVAATAGTSGVIYAVTDGLVSDPSARINSFLHPEISGKPHTGVLLCINGTGIANRWIRELTGETDYRIMNEQAAEAMGAEDGVHFFPFGNGAERMLGNRNIHASFSGLSFNRHGRDTMYRAVQEGIAFSFSYGFDLLKGMGVTPDTIRVPRANLFLSPLFCRLFAELTGVTLEVYDTDGARGAALAAGAGLGLYSGIEEIPLQRTEAYSPGQPRYEKYKTFYSEWKQSLLNQLIP